MFTHNIFFCKTLVTLCQNCMFYRVITLILVNTVPSWDIVILRDESLRVATDIPVSGNIHQYQCNKFIITPI